MQCDTSADMPRLNPVLEQLATYPIFALEQRKAALRKRGVRLFDFGTGDPVEPTPQFIRDALVGAVQPSCPYPSIRGKGPIRRVIADYLQRRYGVTVDPNTQVLPTAGSKEAVFHLPLLVVDQQSSDNVVVFPDPGYPAYQRGVMFAGGTPHAVVLEGDQIFRPWLLPDALLDRTRMIWVNSPHNPTGAVHSLQQLQRIADLCRERDILLASDESYADIYSDVRPPSALETGVDNVVVLHSLSKRSGMTGYRSGFLAGDPAIIAALTTLRSNPGLAPQDFVNAAACAAWADDEHVAARRRVFAAKKAILIDFFDEVGIEVAASEATIYLWVRAPEGETDETWAARLLEAGIVVSPGRMFGVAGGGQGYIRVALVPSEAEIRDAIAVWRTLL